VCCAQIIASWVREDPDSAASAHAPAGRKTRRIFITSQAAAGERLQTFTQQRRTPEGIAGFDFSLAAARFGRLGLFRVIFNPAVRE
jgi:hypothetical protein